MFLHYRKYLPHMIAVECSYYQANSLTYMLAFICYKICLIHSGTNIITQEQYVLFSKMKQYEVKTKRKTEQNVLYMNVSKDELHRFFSSFKEIGCKTCSNVSKRCNANSFLTEYICFIEPIFCLFV